jgi:hypothetical protein
MTKRFEILYGDRAVWVNDADGCLGRFGKNGIDVHQTISKQEDGASQCPLLHPWASHHARLVSICQCYVAIS